MCIAIYKPEGVAFPSKKTLKTCFNNNPDGAGYMYADGRRVHIKKGFFTFSSFWRAIKRERGKFGDALPFVLHFRITTHGGTSAECCHPFPVSGAMDDLRETETTARLGVAHNGIISVETPPRGADYSDTMLFVTDYLSAIVRDGRTPTDARVLGLIARLAGSRLALLDFAGACELLGDGWRNDGGVWYSNGSYIPPSRLYTTPTRGIPFDPATDCPLGDDATDCADCAYWADCLEWYMGG